MSKLFFLFATTFAVLHASTLINASSATTGPASFHAGPDVGSGFLWFGDVFGPPGPFPNISDSYHKQASIIWSAIPNAGYGTLAADLSITTGSEYHTSILGPPQQYPFANGPNPMFDVGVKAGFNDVWTVDAGAPGSLSSLVLTFLVTGSSSVSRHPDWNLPTNSATINGTSGSFDTVTRGIAGGGIFTLELPIYSGVATPVSIFLDLFARTFGPNASVNLNYGHTAILSSASLFQEGEQVSFALDTESGAPGFSNLELQPGSEVPEPGTWGTAMASLVGAVLWTQRRKLAA